jgi:hypothetical protein
VSAWAGFWIALGIYAAAYDLAAAWRYAVDAKGPKGKP